MPNTIYEIKFKEEKERTKREQKIYNRLLEFLQDMKEENDTLEWDFSYEVYEDSEIHIEFDEEETNQMEEIEYQLNELKLDWDCFHPRFWGKDTLTKKRRNGVTHEQYWHPEYDESYISASELKGILKRCTNNDEIAEVMKKIAKENDEFENL